MDFVVKKNKTDILNDINNKIQDTYKYLSLNIIFKIFEKDLMLNKRFIIENAIDLSKMCFDKEEICEYCKLK